MRTYSLTYKCGNCGQVYVVTYEHGHEALTWFICLVCGIKSVKRSNANTKQAMYTIVKNEELEAQ